MFNPLFPESKTKENQGVLSAHADHNAESLNRSIKAAGKR